MTLPEPTAAALDLPLDAHLHTDLSPDADVPLDAYAALARARNVAELAITDHLDFEPGAPAYGYAEFDRRERVVREAAERWEGRPAIRLGVEVTYQAHYEAEIREHLRVHTTTTSSAPSMWRGSTPWRGRRRLPRGRGRARWRRRASGTGPRCSARSAAGCSTRSATSTSSSAGWSPTTDRYEFEAHADIYDTVLRALVEAGIALEVNSSGMRTDIPGPFPHPGEPYPPAAVVARFRALGGTHVVAGSDAHRVASFAGALPEAYAVLREAGFERLAFRRGGDPVEVDLATRPLVAEGAR